MVTLMKEGLILVQIDYCWGRWDLVSYNLIVLYLLHCFAANLVYAWQLFLLYRIRIDTLRFD